ncbi:hypothetical protein B1R94_13435 [Mycolicibacterium litorale]|nr:hypothetical protein B1R94_13435 [Mycolicibacterium litorale]
MSTPHGSDRPPEAPTEQDASADRPVVDDSAKAKAKEMAKAYEDRPTAVLPGSGGTVTGTAVNEWLDDDGQPIYGRDNEVSDEDNEKTNPPEN